MIDVTMPRLSDTMEEGTIVAWLKRPGDQVDRGDVLAEIETDKATVELEAFDAGILDRIDVAEGMTVAIGTVVAWLRSPDEAPSGADPVSQESGSSAAAEVPPAINKSLPSVEPVRPPSSPATGTRVVASPLAKAVAKQQGIELAGVPGSGPGGRILRADVDRVTAGSGSHGTSRSDHRNEVEPVDSDDEIEPLSSMRSIVARRMSESVREAPHFYVTVTFAAEELLALRATLRTMSGELEEVAAPSVNDLIVLAASRTLVRHRDINASFDEDRIVRRHGVHIGIAVALERGLIVPVVRDADRKSVSTIAAESRELSERARVGKLRPEEFRGSTFTVSNLGMFGIEQFTAIINQPEAAILAVGAVRDEPVVRDGLVVPGKVCSLTLSSDHRIIDGAGAARFLADLKSLLEEPLRLLA
jgi:pyruvate dehydrogenase E2 component (dihydrolipoamide acetyltransferase)